MKCIQKGLDKVKKDEDEKQYNEHGGDEHRVLGEKGRESGTRPKRGRGKQT